LFNALEVLLHFRYTSTEIREGTIEHFRTYLQKQDTKAIASYQLELNRSSLIEMHNISDPEEYLNKMSRSTSIEIAIDNRGLWGDIFCIHWASNWLKIPIRVWSKSRMKSYLHFNLNLSTNTYDILFHDENPLAGHFEPLLCKKTIHRSPTLQENKVNEVHMFESTYGESSFETLCQLQNNEYNVSCL
jgi:hypothetical protein